MEQHQNTPFPEQTASEKIHGSSEDTRMKEKYLRDAGKIEDLPEDEQVAKMSSGSAKDESTHLTDRSGEEKKEDYINTDERKKDLNQRGV